MGYAEDRAAFLESIGQTYRYTMPGPNGTRVLSGGGNAGPPNPRASLAPDMGGGVSSVSGSAGGAMSNLQATVGSMPGMQAAPEAPTLTDAADKARLLTYGARNKKSTVLTKGNEKKGPVKTRGLYNPGDEVAKEKLGKSKLTSILGA